MPCALVAPFSDESTASPCPMELALASMGGKWKPRMLALLGERTQRFRELERRLPQVSRKVLVEQLRHLQASGFVQRTVYPEVPSRVEYALTVSGERVLPVLHALADLGRSLLAERAPEGVTIGG